MKKITISLFLIFMLSFSLASAISVLSSSQIDFTSNDPNYNGPAFVVTGVENNGQDNIIWSFSNFDDKLPEGYDMTRTGSIKSDFRNYYWSHPIQITAVDVGAKLIGTDKYLWQSNALEWCEDLDGDYLIKTSGFSEWQCVDYDIEGYVAQFNQGEWNYNLDYIVTIDGVGSDKITLSQTASSGSKLIGPNRQVVAVVETMGTTFRADPILDAKIKPYYRFGSGEWIILANSFPPGAFNNPENFPFSLYSVSFQGIDDCFNYYSGLSSNPAKTCITAYNQAKEDFLELHYGANIFNTDLDFSGVSTTTFTGSVKYNDGLIYRNPLVTLTINADDLVVERNFGKAQITDVQYPRDMIIGQTYSFAVSVKNIGEADMDATLNMNCPSFSVNVPQRFPIKKGETVTKTGEIIFTETVVGCEDSLPCQLEVMNTNLGVVDDAESFISEICRPSECSKVGSSTCRGDDVLQCNSLEGAYVYQKVQTCKPGECFVEDGIAQCETETDSDYKLCPNGVRVLKTDECPNNTLLIIISVVSGLAILLLIFYFNKGKSNRGGPINLG